MRTALLKLARRYPNGARYWSVPGAPNPARLMPGAASFWNTAAFHWPAQRPNGDWEMRGVRLDWHKPIARAAILELLRNNP